MPRKELDKDFGNAVDSQQTSWQTRGRLK